MIAVFGRLPHIIDWIAPPEGPPIEAWRRRILAAVLLGICVLGAFAYAVGATAAYRNGETTVVVVDTVVYLLMLGVTVARRLPYPLRAAITAVLPGLLGVYFLFDFGFVAAGFPWILTFPIFAGVLLGLRAGFWALAIMTLTLVGLGLLIPTNVMPWTAAMPTAQTMWWVSSSSVITLAGLVAISAGYLFDGLGREAEARQVAEREADRRERLAALGTLTGGIAHDFNNLLQPIVSDAEHARRLLDEGHEAAQRLDDVLLSAHRARTLVRRILSFARPAPHGEREVVDLAAMVSESERLLRAVLPTNVQLVTELADDVRVTAEPAELQQVLLNLVTNASHAMSRGGTIRIGVREVAGGAAWSGTVLAGVSRLAVLTVSDTGTGMSGETLARAFEPFYTTKQPGHGTGLGLSTVFATVTALGGIVRAESELGTGTRVTVWLPTTATTVPPSARIARVAATSEQPVGAHIVVVDDEPAVLMATTRLIERIGYRVTSVGHPAELLTQFDQLDPPPALVLTDLSMPTYNGWELATALRERRPALPIVLMTGNLELGTESESAGAASLNGPQALVSGVLSKPFTSAELRAMLQRCLP